MGKWIIFLFMRKRGWAAEVTEVESDFWTLRLIKDFMDK
jgi:hypothetical protein